MQSIARHADHLHVRRTVDRSDEAHELGVRRRGNAGETGGNEHRDNQGGGRRISHSG